MGVVFQGARFKAVRAGAKQVRLAEFSQELVEPHWCEKGHAGYVLEGVLGIYFHDRKEIFAAGDGLIYSRRAGQQLFILHISHLSLCSRVHSLDE